MEKIAFYTLGCKSNQYDTEVLKAQFTANGSQLTDFDSLADIYVINTCTVTQLADHKSRQAIRKALRQNPQAKVIVTGCYANLESDYLKKIFPQITLTPISPLPQGEGGPRRTSGGVRVRAFLKIQNGCEHFCSYCIVPFARGKVSSKTPQEILSEAKKLVEMGAKEIILTGINLGAYQYDLKEILNLLSPIESLYRIRLSSLEPMYITKELVNAMAQTPKVCHHLHLPLQSGDDDLLKVMNRNHSRQDYLELVDYIRSRMPDAGINTDIMVGFPGEGEKEFQNTVDLINQIKFSRLHIFTYSPRKGTPAAEMVNQIDAQTKKKRSKFLQQLRKKYMREFALSYLGKEVEILGESIGEGLTDNYIRILYPGKENALGRLQKLTLKEIKEEYCLAS